MRRRKMADRYDLVTSKQDSSGKWRSHKVGVMFPAKDGGDSFTIKLESLPLPNEKGDVWVRAWPPRDDDGPRRSGPSGGVSSGRKTPPAADPDDSDIPF
jgi:hypothetical protein